MYGPTQKEPSLAPIVKPRTNGTSANDWVLGKCLTKCILLPVQVFNQRGITPRALHHIFRAAESKPEGSVHVRVSYLEIYNETMYDLLADAPGSSNGLTVTEDANGSVEVRRSCLPRGLREKEKSRDA